MDMRPIAVVLMGAEFNKWSLWYIFTFHGLLQNSKNEWNAFENQHTYPTSASLNKQLPQIFAFVRQHHKAQNI